MNMVVDAQRAWIGIKTTNAQLNYKITQPIVEMKTEYGSPNAEQTKLQIKIDQSQCFSESGLKGILELSKENCSNAINLMYESVGRIVDQGNALANFHMGGNTIADQGYYNAYEQFDRDFNMVTMPKSRPKIDFVGGGVTFNPTRTVVQMTPKLIKPEFNYHAGNVEVYMKQHSQIQVRFEGLNLDLKG